VLFDKAVPLVSVINDIRITDSKKEILRKASFIEVIQTQEGYDYKYYPSDVAYLSLTSDVLEKLNEIICVIYKNALSINKYEVRKNEKEGNQTSVVMEVKGQNVLSVLKEISEQYNLFFSQTQDVENRHKQKRISLN